MEGGTRTVCDDHIGAAEQGLPLGSRANIHKAAHGGKRNADMDGLGGKVASRRIVEVDSQMGARS